MVLNLSPAHIRKRGTGLDLAMALAILNLPPQNKPNRTQANLSIAAWGELGLDGTVKSVGQLTRTLYACWKEGIKAVFVPKSDYTPALHAIKTIQESEEFSSQPPFLIPVHTLLEAWIILKDGSFLSHSRKDFPDEDPDDYSRKDAVLNTRQKSNSDLLPLSPSFERVIGTVASGRHHLLLLGPRGVGKTHLLDWLAWIHPSITPVEKLRRTLLSELGQFSDDSDPSVYSSQQVPVRKISSQVRPGALIGGLTALNLRPGEFSLAHGGILIADELPEWSRDSRESLREPLEKGQVLLTRAKRSHSLPAQFLLAANGNICPCGGIPIEYLRNPQHNADPHSRRPAICQCSFSARKAYLSRLSGPILDRIDILLFIREIPQEKSQDRSQETPPLPYSNADLLKEKVQTVNEELQKNWGKAPGILSSAEIELILNKELSLKENLQTTSFISLRSRHKISRIALTLAAWDGAVVPSRSHFLEASFYRPEQIDLFNGGN